MRKKRMSLRERSAARAEARSIALAKEPVIKKQKDVPVACIVTSNLGIGGAERVNLDLVSGLVESFETHLIVCTGLGGVFADRLSSRCKVHFCKDRDEIESKIIEIKADAVIYNNGWAGSDNHDRLVKKYRPGYSGMIIHGETRNVMNVIRAHHGETLTGLIAISDSVKSSIEKSHNEFIGRIDVLQNCVDTDRFNPDVRPFDITSIGWRKNDPIFCYVGRLSSEKRLCGMIDAVAIAKRSCPRLRLLIVGGNDRDIRHMDAAWNRSLAEIEKKIKDRDLSDSIHITGMTAEPEKYIAVSDSFLLSSCYEGLPLAILEAMSCGKPFVSTDVGYVGKLAGDRERGLVTHSEPVSTMNETEIRDLAAACVAMASDKAARLEMGEKARSYVVENHSQADYGRKVKTLVADKLGIEVKDIPDTRPDYSDDLTVFIVTVGSEEFPSCVQHIKNQDCRFMLKVIRNVAPMSAAFQQMIDNCETPFYIQVDEDMHLKPSAVRELYSGIADSDETCAIYCRPLHEGLRDVIVDGVKSYRHSITSRYPYDPNSASCEMTQLNQMVSDGYSFEVFPHTEDNQVGELNISWSDSFRHNDKRSALYDVYQKFRRDAAKSVLKETGTKTIHAYLSSLESNKSSFARFAYLGIVSGLTHYEEMKTEKDYRTDPAIKEFDALVKAFD